MLLSLWYDDELPEDLARPDPLVSVWYPGIEYVQKNLTCALLVILLQENNMYGNILRLQINPSMQETWCLLEVGIK